MSAPSGAFAPAPERCDRCTAAAMVTVRLTASGLPLAFCAHHYAVQADALAAVAVVADDQRTSMPAAAVPC